MLSSREVCGSWASNRCLGEHWREFASVNKVGIRKVTGAQSKVPELVKFPPRPKADSSVPFCLLLLARLWTVGVLPMAEKCVFAMRTLAAGGLGMTGLPGRWQGWNWLLTPPCGRQ